MLLFTSEYIRYFVRAAELIIAVLGLHFVNTTFENLQKSGKKVRAGFYGRKKRIGVDKLLNLELKTLGYHVSRGKRVYRKYFRREGNTSFLKKNI